MRLVSCFSTATRIKKRLRSLPMYNSLPEAELVRLWELHTQLEFDTKDAAATIPVYSVKAIVRWKFK